MPKRDIRAADDAGILSRLVDVMTACMIRSRIECGCTEIGGMTDAHNNGAGASI